MTVTLKEFLLMKDLHQLLLNEIWHIKNVPSMADLQVKVVDKDEGVTDDYISKFTVSITLGTKEVEIDGTVFSIARRTLWMKVPASPFS